MTKKRKLFRAGKRTASLAVAAAFMASMLLGAAQPAESAAVEATPVQAFSLQDLQRISPEQFGIDFEQTQSVSEDGLLDMNAFTTCNLDGSKTLHVFEEPVKFLDQDAGGDPFYR